MQRIYKWQNHIGNAAIEALKKLWASDEKYQSPEECTTYVEDALSPALTFLYGDVEKQNDGIFAVSILCVTHGCDADSPQLITPGFKVIPRAIDTTGFGCTPQGHSFHQKCYLRFRRQQGAPRGFDSGCDGGVYILVSYGCHSLTQIRLSTP
jgi:hypothetical protein